MVPSTWPWRCSLLLYFSLSLFVSAYPAVSGAADGRQDDSAAARRHARRLEHVHGLLPGGAARRLWLHASFDDHAVNAPASAYSRLSAFLAVSAVLPFSLGRLGSRRRKSNPIFSLLLEVVDHGRACHSSWFRRLPRSCKSGSSTPGIRRARIPYFLYGSQQFRQLARRTLYPAVIEPWLPVSPAIGDATAGESQVHLWTLGYADLRRPGRRLHSIIVWKALAGRIDA